MKTIVFSLFLILGFNSLISAQETQEKKPVPVAVLEAFKTKFPGVTASGWAQGKNNYYSASFKNDTAMLEAAFDGTGKWISTSTEIQESELPKAVIEVLTKTDYVRWEVANIEKSETLEYPELYQVVYKKGKQRESVYILPDGKLVNKKEEEK